MAVLLLVLLVLALDVELETASDEVGIPLSDTDEAVDEVSEEAAGVTAEAECTVQ